MLFLTFVLLCGITYQESMFNRDLNSPSRRACHETDCLAKRLHEKFVERAIEDQPPGLTLPDCANGSEVKLTFSDALVPCRTLTIRNFPDLVVSAVCFAHLSLLPTIQPPSPLSLATCLLPERNTPPRGIKGLPIIYSHQHYIHYPFARLTTHSVQQNAPLFTATSFGLSVKISVQPVDQIHAHPRECPQEFNALLTEVNKVQRLVISTGEF